MDISSLDKTLTICMKCSATNRVTIEQAREHAPHCGKCGAALAIHSFVSTLGDDQIRKLIQRTGEVPLVVNFWAPWSGPANAFTFTFEHIATRHSGRFVFARVNVEDYPSSGDEFSIETVPTFIIFRGGQECSRKVGMMPESTFEDWMLKISAF